MALTDGEPEDCAGMRTRIEELKMKLSEAKDRNTMAERLALAAQHNRDESRKKNKWRR